MFPRMLNNEHLFRPDSHVSISVQPLQLRFRPLGSRSVILYRNRNICVRLS